MAKMFAGLEAFNARMDEEGETPDINIEIEIDAGAAEDAAEMDEIEQPMEAASAVSEDAEAGEGAAEMMSIMASALRKHGLTPSLHYVIDALDMASVAGTRLTSLEGLDPHGRNDAQARQLIASFEASDGNYWERTKMFLKRVWDYIKEAFNKAVSYFQNYQKAVFKAMQSLKDISAIDVKDIKYKCTKEDLCTAAVVADLAAITKTVTKLPDIKIANPYANMKDAAISLGLKIKEEDKEKGTFKTEVDSDFFATEDKDLEEKLLKDCQKGGERAQAASDLAAGVVDAKNMINTAANAAIEMADVIYRGTKYSGSKDKGDDAADEAKKDIAKTKERADAARKVVTQIIKVAKAGCSDYLRMCAALRKASTATKKVD